MDLLIEVGIFGKEVLIFSVRENRLGSDDEVEYFVIDGIVYKEELLNIEVEEKLFE